MLTIRWILSVAIALASISCGTSQTTRFGHRPTSIRRGPPVRIRPKSCWNTQGQRGRCMFVWDCVRTEGQHLGTCIDGFLFGTCCGKKQATTTDNSNNVETRSPPSTANPAGQLNKTVESPLKVEQIKQNFTINDKLNTNRVATVIDKATTSPPLPIEVPSNIFKDCGIPSMIPQMRIVGGKDSKMGDWPWQVSVRRTVFFGLASTHRCGGSILNENFVITAGHCVAKYKLQMIRIRAGEYDLNSNVELYPHIERGVRKRFLHPNYNSSTYEFDLALVRLDRALNRQPNIFPICLPKSDNDESVIGQLATLTGWGRLHEGGPLPSILQQVRVPLINHTECGQMFAASGRKDVIRDIFICAGYENGGKDSCQGDSGGPLQLKSDAGRWFLVGVISWGISCAQPNLPGVCTRITKFKPWILETVIANT